MKLLLDTCTFLWVASGSHRLSKTAATLFLNPENERYLSAASAWEIGIKHALGRLPLPAKPTAYIAKIRHASGIEPLSVDEEAALYAASLPGIHADPFDRLLVAQAILQGMTILTPDEALQQYPVRTAW